MATLTLVCAAFALLSLVNGGPTAQEEPLCKCTIWSDWSACTKACNGQQRTRNCISLRGKHCPLQNQEKRDGCTSVVCCPAVTDGDNTQEGEKFLQENEMAKYTTCAEACKNLHSESTGITVSKTEKYGDKKDGKAKCWCEFGQPKLDKENENYKTCMLKTA